MTVEAETEALVAYCKQRLDGGTDVFALARALNRVKFLVDEGELFSSWRK